MEACTRRGFAVHGGESYGIPKVRVKQASYDTLAMYLGSPAVRCVATGTILSLSPK